jgi:hypothetical protein
MKKIQISGCVALILGLILKTVHIPGASLLFLLGANVVAVANFIVGMINVQADKQKSLFHLAISLLTVYVLFRFQFWPMGPSILGLKLMFLLPVGLSIAFFIRYFKQNASMQIAQKILAGYLVFVIFISFTPTYKIQYFMQLNPVLSANSRDSNYVAWDKYSWFLYTAGKYDESLEANRKAQQAMEFSTYQLSQLNRQEYKLKLTEHEGKIKDRSWKNWDIQ